MTKKSFIELIHTDSPVKKKFLVQWSAKKVKMTVFWDRKRGHITIDFLEKAITVNSDFYCQLFRQISLYMLNGSVHVNDLYTQIQTYIRQENE